MKRRTLLKIAPAIAVGTAGCTLESTAVIRVTVFNTSSTPHTVSVVLTDGEERLFSQDISVPAGDPVSEATTTFRSSADRGQRLEATVTAGGQTREATLELECGDEYAGNDLTVRIQDGDELSVSGESCFTEE